MTAPVAHDPAKPFDVVVTDMRMPGMSGVDLQARLKALGHDLPMVFVSGESRQEEIIAARSMIANLENQLEFLRVEVKELRRGNLGEIKKELASARAHAATLFQLVATKNRIIEEQAATMKKFIKNPHKVPFDPTKTMKSTKR